MVLDDRCDACIVAYIRLSAGIIRLSILTFNIALYITAQSLVNVTMAEEHAFFIDW